MYVPTFSLTHSILQNVISYELSIHDIKTLPSSIKLQRNLTSSLGQDLVQSFCSTLGIRVSDVSALNLYLGKEIPMPGSTHLVISNFRSVMDYIYASSKDPYAILSPSLLLHLNKLLLNGVMESWEYGRFRSLSDVPSAPYDPWYSTMKSVKLEEDPHRFFLDMFQWFSDKKYSIHQLFKVSVLLYEILRSYPFLSGNFITAIAVGELVLERSKYSTRGIQILSRAFFHNSDELLNALKQSREAEGDVTPWIEAFTKALSVESMYVRNESVRLSDRKLRASKDELAELNARQLKLIRYFRYHPRITRKQFVSQSGVSTMTAYRDLNDLVKRKMILQKGGGRSTYYLLRQKSDEIEEKLESISSEKEVVKVIRDDSLSSQPNDTDRNISYVSRSSGESLFD